MGAAQIVWGVMSPPLLIEWLLLGQEDTELHESQPLEADFTELNLSNKPDDLKLKTKTKHHLQCWRFWPQHHADVIWSKDLLGLSDLLLDKSLSLWIVKISKPNLFSPKLIFPWLQYNREKKLKPNQMKHGSQDICECSQSTRTCSLCILTLSLLRL